MTTVVGTRTSRLEELVEHISKVRLLPLSRGSVLHKAWTKCPSVPYRFWGEIHQRTNEWCPILCGCERPSSPARARFMWLRRSGRSVETSGPCQNLGTTVTHAFPLMYMICCAGLFVWLSMAFATQRKTQLRTGVCSVTQ